MSTDTHKNKVEAWKLLAEQLIAENVSVYIKDINDEYYFGHLLFCGEDRLEIECTGPSFKVGKRFVLRWVTITRFDEDRGKE